MALLTRAKAKETLAKLRQQGVLLKLCPDTSLNWADPKGVLTEAKTAYLRRHKEALASALLREEIDSHYPDDFEFPKPPPVSNGCFSRGETCLIFSEQDMAKMLLSLVNKTAREKVKKTNIDNEAIGQPPVETCGECDLFVSARQIAEMRAKREAHEAELRRKDWANQQAHKKAVAETETEVEEEETTQ